MPVLQTSVHPTHSTTLRSWLSNDGPAGLKSKKSPGSFLDNRGLVLGKVDRQECRSRFLVWSETLAVLGRIDKAGNHTALITGLVQDLNPNRVLGIGSSSQQSEVVHHHKSLVQELEVNLVAIHQLTQHITSRQGRVGQPIDPRLSLWMVR